MGMDVYGLDSSNDAGEYFRANVWYWRPLWDYCCEMHPDLVGDNPELGHYNDGYGLDDDGAMALGNSLLADITIHGTAQAYIDRRNAHLASLPRLDCEWCNGTGIRTDEVGVEMGMPEKPLDEAAVVVLGRTHGWCNGCSGEGKKNDWETEYSLDLETLTEFAYFLVACGGFAIH